jgi:hypothetical protein
LSAWIFGTGFMIVGFLVQLVIVVIANGVFWYWQNKSTTKTITDYPAPGQSRSHQAIWKGENFDRLLSRHVAIARAVNAIDETRKDFDRVGWAAATKAHRIFLVIPGWYSIGSPAIIPTSVAPIRSRNHVFPTSRCIGCAKRPLRSQTA